MAQWLKAYTALVGDLSLVPSTHNRWLTTARNSSSEFDASGLHRPPNSHAHTHTGADKSSKFIDNRKK